DMPCAPNEGEEREGGPGSTFHFVLPFPVSSEETFGELSETDLEAFVEASLGNEESKEAPAGKPLDFSKATEMFDGDMDLFREIATLFVDDFPQKADQIRDGVKKGDGTVVEQGGQNLKDSAGSLGADQIFNLSARLETVGVENRLDEVEAILEALTAAVEALRTLLTEVH
ncbi:MAG: hypothetical protein GY846_01785, partial [Deltaproteobacteria bacterium]|nr:hypothetical protein [Deltaproteobacteria bacterium]